MGYSWDVSLGLSANSLGQQTTSTSGPKEKRAWCMQKEDAERKEAREQEEAKRRLQEQEERLNRAQEYKEADWILNSEMSTEDSSQDGEASQSASLEEDFWCVACDKRFRSSKAMNNHQRWGTASVPASAIPKEVQQRWKFSCSCKICASNLLNAEGSLFGCEDKMCKGHVMFYNAFCLLLACSLCMSCGKPPQALQTEMSCPWLNWMGSKIWELDSMVFSCMCPNYKA